MSTGGAERGGAVGEGRGATDVPLGPRGTGVLGTRSARSAPSPYRHAAADLVSEHHTPGPSCAETGVSRPETHRRGRSRRARHCARAVVQREAPPETLSPPRFHWITSKAEAVTARATTAMAGGGGVRKRLSFFSFARAIRARGPHPSQVGARGFPLTSSYASRVGSHGVQRESREETGVCERNGARKCRHVEGNNRYQTCVKKKKKTFPPHQSRD